MAKDHGLKIAPTDHVQQPRVRPPHVHVSVWQQVLHLKPDGGHCWGDYDVDGPGRRCNEDNQAGSQIAED
jgi:hypothetical protein